MSPAASDAAPEGALPVAAIEDRVAAAFLERLLADRASGLQLALVDYLRSYPGHEARIAAEWLAVVRPPAQPGRYSGSHDTIVEPLDGAAIVGDGEPGSPHTPPRRIAAYDLVRELGRGGQGVVYLATDTRTGRNVALKVLAPEVVATSGLATLRLQREAAALAKLDHSGIATVFEVGEHGSVAFLAMRFVPGGSLQQVLDRRRSVAASDGGGPARTREDVAAAVRLCERAARALAAAHRAGLVHRDVKPANLLLAAADEPVLVDFGLARDDAAAAPTLTMPGTVFGTLCYLPPERLTGAPADARGDVHALGAVLYEMLTLQRPYESPTTAAELHAIATEPLREVRSRNPGVSRDLAVVVATALAKDPAHRYQSAEAFADDLCRVLARQPIAARPAGPWTRTVRFCQREPALAATLGALLVVLVAGLAVTSWLLWRESRALADVTRLADLKHARELREREQTLWPARADRIPEMQRWLGEAAALRRRVPQHQALLAALPTVGVDATADWQREQLEALQHELRDLDQRLASVTARIDVAAGLERRTLVEPREAWAAAAARVRDSSRYGGLELRPQLGLVPLGPDPRSGLEEFAHVTSGTVPTRDGAGVLQLDEASGIVLVLVPGGRVVLGAEKAAPSDGREANVDPSATSDLGPCYVAGLEPFFLGKVEITQAQWQRHTGRNPSTYRPDSELTRIASLQHPVEMVTWDEAERALAQLDLQLPTEAQWEAAYRAGASSPFPHGTDAKQLQGRENLCDVTWKDRGGNERLPFLDWLDDGHLVHAPIGSFQPNAWGLHDMGGNVKEWCADSWEDYPAVAPREGDGLRRGKHDRFRIVRGGSFSSTDADARSAARFGVDRTASGPEAGVRAARSVL